MRFAMQLVLSCLRSRLAWLLAAIHASWFYLAVENMGPPSRGAANFLDGFAGADWTMFAGRAFHFTYESIYLKGLIAADLPAGLVGVPLGMIISPVLRIAQMGRFEESYVSAYILFILATFHWLVVGRLVEGSITRVFKKSGRDG